MEKRRKLNDLFIKNRIDIPFFIILLALLTVGLVMLLSSSYFSAFYNTDNGDSLYYFKRQLIWVVSGILLMFAMSKVNYKYYKIIGFVGMAGALFLLLLVLALPSSDGIKRWIYLGPIQFQPSEVAKFTLILFLAGGLDADYKKINSRKPSRNIISKKLYAASGKKLYISEGTVSLLFYFIVVLFTAGLVMLESHLSGTILILGIGIMMLWFGEGRLRWFVIAGIAGVAVVTFLIIYIKAKNFENVPFLKQYMVDRIRAWLDKDFEPRGLRWQTNQSLYAIGSGGFLGAGLGNSKEKYLYVSEPQNDFIFAIISEELGFVGAVGIFALYIALVLRGLYIGLKARNRFGSLLCFGMVSQLALQVILNVGVVSDLLPNTGIGLPFFSYGGTSMWLCLAEMGVILSVSRQSDLPKVYSFRKRKIKNQPE